MLTKKTLRLILSVLLLISCGKKDDKKSKDNDGDGRLVLTPFEQISGEWEGSYKSLSEGKPIGEPSFVKVTFSSDSTFIIMVEGETSGRVQGYWREFQGETLILRVTGSNVARIGSHGKLIEPIYELIGNGLRIFTESFELNLSKKSDQISGPRSGIVGSRFTGTWNCDDGSSRKTKVLVSEDSKFKLSSVQPSERIFTAVGKTTLTSDQILKLVADSTSEPLVEGSYFEMIAAGETFELTLIRPGQDIIHLGRCSH